MGIDDILNIIDAGLQSSTETGYPERYDRDDQCARCLTNEPVEGGDMCTGCRAFLLGDSEDDPKAQRADGFRQRVMDGWSWTPTAWIVQNPETLAESPRIRGTQPSLVTLDEASDIDLSVWHAPEYPLPVDDLNPYLDMVRENVRLLAAEAGFTMQEWQRATLGAWITLPE